MAEHLDEALRHLEAHARVPESEDMGPERQHRPHLGGRQLVADADGMGAEEPVLEGGSVLRCQVDVGQAPEARRHPVDDGPGGDGPLDDGS